MNDKEIEKFSYFITQPSLKLIDVLMSQFLGIEIIKQNNLLFSYFQQEHIILELAEWCFTSKHKDYSNVIQISEISFAVIMNSSQSFIDFLLTNKSFASVLNNFLISNDSNNPRLCGHFCEVVSLLIKSGKPILFTNYPKVQTHLLKHIEVLGISNLIAQLISANVDYIDSEQILKVMCYNADFNDDKDSIHLIVSLFELALADTQLKELFQNSIILSHLLNVAVKTTSSVIQSDILDFLVSINCNSNMIYDQKLIVKMTISENNINDLTISAIDFLQLPIDYIVGLFFAKNHCINRLHQKIISKMETMNLGEFIKIANIPNFVLDIISAFGTERWCPHCFQIVIFLTNIENYCKPLKSKKWNIFIRDKIFPLIKIMNNEYGGHAPEQDEENDNEQIEFDDDDILKDSDEENDEKFEEEEEFYDDIMFKCEEEGCDVENIESSEGDDIEFEIDI